LAWRYALEKNQVEAWLRQTEWSVKPKINHTDLEKTVEMLLELGLVNQQEAKDWQEKLF